MKTYKLQIEEKDREINKLKEKEMFLNKRVKILDSKKNINISNSNEIRSDSMSIINSTRREFSNFTIKNHKKCPINIIKRNNKSNYSNNQASFNNSSIKNKKMINSTIGLSTVNLNKSEINTSLVKKNNKPNTNESINYHLNKMNQSHFNNKNSRNSFRKFAHTKQAKNLVNIMNNNFSVQKNNILINLSNLNHEKVIIQKKLEDYLKIIDTKINKLKNRRENRMSSYNQSKSFLKRKGNKDKFDSYKHCESKKSILNKSTVINNSSSELAKTFINYRNPNKIDKPTNLKRKIKK